jgi:hypothetical protein
MALTLILVVFCYTLSGFLLSRIFIHFLVLKQNVTGSSGFLGNQLKKNAEILGNRIVDEVLASPSFSSALNAENVLEQVRPEIEGHIDHFLEVKLKTVFPLLSQFIGAKTQGQMKSAFMDEMDRLFPELLEKFSASFLSREKLSAIISERIRSFDTSSGQIRYFIRKKIQPRLDLFFSLFMMVAGSICALLIFLLSA